MTNEELLRQYYAGDDSAFETLYKRNIGFIKKIAVEAATDFHCVQHQTTGKEKYTAYTDIILNDLCAEGAAEFWDRIQRREFDERKAQLTTYLYPHLKGRMYRWLEQNIGPMALSKEEMTAVRQAQKLYHENWKDTSEVAAEMGLSEEQAAKHIGYNTHSLSVYDLVLDTENSDPFEFLMQDSLAIPVDRIVHRKICIEYLEELFDQLSAKDKYILGHSYGVYGYEKHSIDQIAMREMLTHDGVTKAKKIALKHLRNIYPSSKLHRWLKANRAVKEAQASDTDT